MDQDDMDQDCMDQDRTRDGCRDWRELCQEAASELDPVKLMNLIAQLTKALNERDRNRQPATAEEKNSKAITLQRKLAV